MSLEFIIILIFLVVFAVVIWLLLQNMRSELSEKLQDKIGEGQKEMNESVKYQFSESKKLVEDIATKLGKVEKQNENVVGFAEQLRNLQNILKNPKQRGVLGEYFLENILKNVLPPDSFRMQYKFSNKDIVDAVVFVKDKIVPIDSKFSLENYERILDCDDEKKKVQLEKSFKQDLKMRIDETSKYIKPEEGTMDFAFMFVPSEAIYYDLLINKVGSIEVDTRSLIEYAFQDKHVIIVSPTSFLAYLQTVLQGLRSLQIEESAKEIRTNVEKLGKHIVAFDDYYKKLGKSMSTTVGRFNDGYDELNKMDKDVIKITGKEKEIEPMVLEKPKEE